MELLFRNVLKIHEDYFLCQLGCPNTFKRVRSKIVNECCRELEALMNLNRVRISWVPGHRVLEGKTLLLPSD